MRVRVSESERERGRGREGEREITRSKSHTGAIGLIRLDMDTIARDRGVKCPPVIGKACFLVTLHARLSLPSINVTNGISSPSPAARKLSPRGDRFVEGFTFFFYGTEYKARTLAPLCRDDPANDTGSGWYWLSMIPRRD